MITYCVFAYTFTLPSFSSTAQITHRNYHEKCVSSVKVCTWYKFYIYRMTKNSTWYSWYVNVILNLGHGFHYDVCNEYFFFIFNAFWSLFHSMLLKDVVCNHWHDNNADEGKNLKLVDAPVSGGVVRASMGTLTVWNTSLAFIETAF